MYVSIVFGNRVPNGAATTRAFDRAESPVRMQLNDSGPNLISPFAIVPELLLVSRPLLWSQNLIEVASLTMISKAGNGVQKAKVILVVERPIIYSCFACVSVGYT